MRGLKGFLIFLSAIALLGTLAVWWFGPQLLGLVLDEEQRSKPLTVIHLADYQQDKQSRYFASYETPLLDYMSSEGVATRWHATLVHAPDGRIRDEWKRIHQLRFDEAGEFLQMVTSSEFRGLSASDVEYRRMVLAAGGDLPEIAAPAVVLMLLERVDTLPVDLTSLTANLSDYRGAVVWNTAVEVFEIGEVADWTHLLAFGFATIGDAESWLRDPGSVTERALASTRHVRIATLLVSTAAADG